MSILRSGLAGAIACMAMVGLFSAPAALAANDTVTRDEAQQFIESLGGKAIDMLRDQDVELETREAKLQKMMRQHLDLPFIGRFVLGRHWRAASDDQRDAYQKLFAKHILQSYSRLLGGYSGQTFMVEGVRQVGRNDALVETRIEQEDAEPIRAGWRIRQGEDGLKIIDLMVEGVSMAQTKRDEFSQVITKSGIDGLIETLRLKVTKYAARP